MSHPVVGTCFRLERTINLCLSTAINAIVYEEKNTVTAGDVRTTLHNNHDCGPNGQYLVIMPSKVMGIVNKHSVESAIAKVAIKIFRAVLIPRREEAVI